MPKEKKTTDLRDVQVHQAVSVRADTVHPDTVSTDTGRTDLHAQILMTMMNMYIIYSQKDTLQEAEDGMGDGVRWFGGWEVDGV